MYTRNYRIQHSERRADSPQGTEQRMDGNNAAVGDLGVGGADEGVNESRTEELGNVYGQDGKSSSAFSEEVQEDNVGAPRRLKAVRRYRVRSPESSHPEAEESAKREEGDTNISGNEDEKADESREQMSDGTGFEPKSSEPARSRRFVGRQERGFEKKQISFGQNNFGIKNFSPEDIFLAAILLLLLNEGCEDIMTLILGFLLIS